MVNCDSIGINVSREVISLVQKFLIINGLVKYSHEDNDVA